MKYILTILMMVIFTGCLDSHENKVIKEECKETELWITQGGKSRARPVYDCTGIKVRKEVK